MKNIDFQFRWSSELLLTFYCNTASTLTNIPSVTNESSDTLALQTEHTVSPKIDVDAIMFYKSSSPRINREHFFEKLSFFYSEWKTIEEAFLRFFTVASFSWLCILLPTMNTIWKHDNPLIIENDNYNWYQNYSCIILEWVRSQRQRYLM